MASLLDDGDGEILEGFLCPICKDDLKTPERLTNHVEQKHSEEQDILKSLKEIFGIARKKILNLDESADLAKSVEVSMSLKPNIFSVGKPREILEESSQEVGVDCEHTVYFKAVRNPRLERYATETNKLIIRLHKLLTDRPRDPIQRKMHEQERVPWLDGKAVKLCPNCARSFHLTRRQHHCRLCGSIMCHDCSRFLDVASAECLLNPSGDSTPTDIEAKSADSADLTTLRICEHCLHLLENRKEMQDRTTFRPTVTRLYDRVQELKRDISPDIPMYRKIVTSLYEGDSIFTLADASALRSKIGRVAEQVDNVSKGIMALPTPQGSRAEALKKALRLACVSYIKEEMLSLPQLPLEEEIERLQRKRREEAEMRIERERRLAAEAFERYEQSNTLSSGVAPNATRAATGSAVTRMDNWSGYRADTSGPNADPLVEQINIIKGYIKQAREALRFEEVATLEMNLRELQQEFYNRQQNV
ncbi:rabenosyn-5 [Phlebotomus argentipes]|uniref:rabenosyn-5 n=1 Tax=Phlebotomus argentipes TaxID=94469 RepID=UPI00289381AC|nr:rabenosyn-5 [Phlebotomus argentipes]